MPTVPCYVPFPKRGSQFLLPLLMFVPSFLVRWTWLRQIMPSTHAMLFQELRTFLDVIKLCRVRAAAIWQLLIAVWAVPLLS